MSFVLHPHRAWGMSVNLRRVALAAGLERDLFFLGPFTKLVTECAISLGPRGRRRIVHSGRFRKPG